MSVEERTTLERILEAACEEFLRRGFRDASLRNIVKKAGVTTGAFYGYFRSKEALFDALVKEPYTYLMDRYRQSLEHFAQLEPQAQRDSMESYSVWVMTQMTDYIYDHFRAFKLLLCCAEGTPYENVIHALSQMECEATHRFSKEMDRSGLPMNTIHPQLEHMLISGMFCAYFELVVHEIPRASSAAYIRQLIQFYSAGWQKIMGF